MLAEATKSARAVAQQFANDSGSRLGQIRRAKTVRLVTTVDYYLQD